MNAESTGAANRRFTSYDRSTSTGLDYAINRHYDPQQGRFTQVDPISMSAASIGDPQSFNSYSYTQNDPVNFVDPSGLTMSDGGFCPAQYSFSDCGGWAGIYGGYFGSDYAEYQREYGGMSAEAAEALRLHNQRVTNSMGGYGFLTTQEVLNRFGGGATDGHAILCLNGLCWDAGSEVWSVGNMFSLFGGSLDQWPPQWPRGVDGFDQRYGWRTQPAPEMEQFPTKPHIENGKLKFGPEFDPNKVPSNSSRSSRIFRGTANALGKFLGFFSIVGGTFTDMLGPVVMPNTQVKQAVCRQNPNNPGCWGPPQ